MIAVKTVLFRGVDNCPVPAENVFLFYSGSFLISCHCGFAVNTVLLTI